MKTTEEETRPHWVKTLDHNLTHSSSREEWNKSIASSTNRNNNTAMEHKKKKSENHGNKTAKKSKQSDPHTGKSYNAMFYRGHYSDTSSIGSRVTSSSMRKERRDRKKSRRLGLFLILLIIAFIVAALLGWLMYYLLTKDRPRSRAAAYDRNRLLAADASLRFLNETYHEDMAKNGSYQFRRIAELVCQEMDSFFLSSNLSKSYNGCVVAEIRNVADEPGCQCAWSNDGSLLVHYKLFFNGTHSKDKIRWTIFDIIDKGVTKHYVGSMVYVMLRHFLVDIRSNWKMAIDGIEALLTFPVFNLNYTYNLESVTSPDFRDLAVPFCNDVSRILTDRSKSMFADRYYTCEVVDFSPRPDRVSFKVQLTGREWRSIQKMLIYVLISGARNATIQSQTVKMIGTLMVTPYDMGFELIPTNITRTTTTNGPDTTTPTTLPDLVYVYVILPTYNLTITPDLRDPTSPRFIDLTTEFCKDLERLYDMSIYGYRFYNCKVHSFRINPPAVVVSVGYLGGEWPGMDGSVHWVIRRHAPWIYAPGEYLDLKEVYLVGSIYVILGELAANGLELRTNLRVVNLTYSSDLEDQRTPAFQYHSYLFCRDMKRFYQRSYYADRFFECGVDQYTDDPVRIHFYLVFYGTSLNGLDESIVGVIRQFAQRVYYQNYLAYLVGDLLVLPEAVPIPPSIHPTNITVFPTSTTDKPLVTSSITPTLTTNTEIVTPYGIMLVLYYEVYNLTFTDDLRNQESPAFQRHRDAVCDDLWRWYMAADSPFIAIYRACDVTSFHNNPTGVTFTLLFNTLVVDGFALDVREHLETKAPKVYVPRYNLLDVGHLLLIIDRYRIQVTSSIVPSHTLAPPTVGPSTILTTSFTMTQTATPTEMTVTSTLTSTSLPYLSVVSFDFGLADFDFTSDLYDRDSAMFRWLLQGFCKDIDRYYEQSALRGIYDSCTIDEFKQRIIEVYPERIRFSFQFNTAIFPEIRNEVTDILFQRPPVVFRSGYKTLNVGDLFLIIDSYVTNNPGTESSEIIYTPTETNIMTPTRSVIPIPTQTVEPSSTAIPTTPTTTTTPTPTPTISTEPTYFIRLSFETLNLTFTEALKDRNSLQFKYIEDRFCADIDEILVDRRQMFPSYMRCQIDIFGGDPLRVNFSLQFRDLEGTNRTAVKDLLVSMLIENALREEYQGIFALLVGNLLIAMDSITVEFPTVSTTASIYNAIGYNYTFYLYPGNYSVEFLNKDFQAFKEKAYLFCQDVDEIFESSGLRAIRNRYHGCVVDEFGPKGEVKFRVVLRETDVVRPSSMYNIFAYHGDQFSLDGVFYLPLGGMYVAVDLEPSYYLLILESFTTHPYPFITTTPTILYTVVTITLDVLEPGWSADLNDVTSANYSLLAEPFCSDVSGWVSDWNPDYIRCGNVKFRQEPFQIVAELTFRGQQLPGIEDTLNTIILELANRILIDNLYAMEIGKMLIFDKSLVLSQRTVSVGETTESNQGSPATTLSISTSTTPRTTTPLQPCLGVANLQYVPHPTECDEFYQCVSGVPLPISCVPGSIYQGNTCVPEPPGFVCNK